MKSEILGMTELSYLYDKTTTVLLLDHALFNVTTPGYFKIYEKVLVSRDPKCPFYSITGSTTLNMNKDITNLTYTYGINKLNINGFK